MHSLRRLHARLRGDTLELWLPREDEREGLAQNQATKGRLATAYAFPESGSSFLRCRAPEVAHCSIFSG